MSVASPTFDVEPVEDHMQAGTAVFVPADALRAVVSGQGHAQPLPIQEHRVAAKRTKHRS